MLTMMLFGGWRGGELGSLGVLGLFKKELVFIHAISPNITLE